MAKQTINTLPGADANFVPDLNTFLQDEIALRYQAQWQQRPDVISGGIGATDASLSHTISECIAFPNGYYVLQEAVSHTYTATKDTYVYLRDDDTRTVEITGYTITYDEHLVFAEYDSGVGSTQPTTPSGCIPLFLATTNGTSITTITDLRFSLIGEVVYAEWWGAVGDGSTDDTVALQSAVDYLAYIKGGVLQLQKKSYVGNITLGSSNSGITIRGAFPIQGYASYLSSLENVTQLIPASAGSVIDTPATEIRNITIENIYFYGLGAGTACHGIHLDYVGHSIVRNCAFANFSDQAILADLGCGALTISGNVAHQCLLAAQGSVTAVFDLCVADSFIYHNEISGGLSALYSTNFYKNAFRIGINTTGGNNFIHNNVGENADVGFYINSSENTVIGNRADINYGHGFAFVGAGGNVVSGNKAKDVGLETDDTYYGFYADSSSGSNVFVGNRSWGQESGNQPKAGFYDGHQASTTYAGNRWSNNISLYHATAAYLYVGYRSGRFQCPQGCPYLASDLDATPNLDGQIDFIVVNYTSNTTITNFENASPGHMLYILKTGGAGTVTLQHGTYIKTNTGANVDITNNIIYTFKYFWGAWYQVI